MCSCSRTQTWATNLKLGLESKQYVVQLKRVIGCCREDYQIFVNGEQLEDHGLFYNPCSPACGSGGSYEWDQDGHHFHIIFDGLSLRRCSGQFRLFVDGIDADSGREFTAFWRRRGIQLLIIGTVFILLAVLVYIIVFVVFKVTSDSQHLSSMTGSNVLFAWGIVYFIFAAILFRKYSQPKSYPYSSASSWSNTANYQTFRNV